MVFNTWADVLSQSFQNLSYGLIAFIPNLVIAIVIFIVGWLIGVGLGRVVKQIVDALRIDSGASPDRYRARAFARRLQALFRQVSRLPRQVVLHYRLLGGVA